MRILFCNFIFYFLAFPIMTGMTSRKKKIFDMNSIFYFYFFKYKLAPGVHPSFFYFYFFRIDHFLAQ
jgi:hypothetical protein